MRLWEVAEIGSGRRASLHWTRKAAELAAAGLPGYMERMRTLPEWTRPLHRFVWW